MNNSKFAVFTMCKNEHVFLPIWHRYYSAEVGSDNVYILDDNSTDDYLTITKNIKKVNSDQKSYNAYLRSRVSIVSGFQKELLKSYQYVIFCDADEIIFHNKIALSEFMDNEKRDTISCNGINLSMKPTDTDYNPLTPMREQRTTILKYTAGEDIKWFRKPAISKQSTSWKIGFHSCRNNAIYDENVIMLHLKFFDRVYFIERAIHLANPKTKTFGANDKYGKTKEKASEKFDREYKKGIIPIPKNIILPDTL